MFYCVYYYYYYYYYYLGKGNNNVLSASTTCFDLNVSSSGNCKMERCSQLLFELIDSNWCSGVPAGQCCIFGRCVLGLWFVLCCIEVLWRIELKQNTNPGKTPTEEKLQSNTNNTWPTFVV